jgi:uncharacterized membrane protein
MAATSMSFSVGDSLSRGWDVFKKNWAFVYLVFVITFIASMIPGYLMGLVQDSGNSTMLIILLQIVNFVWSSAVSMGAMYVMVRVARSENVEVSDFLTPLNRLGTYVMGTVLYALIVIAGTILLIIPGIIWGLKYMFVPFLIADKGLGVSEAMKASAQMSEGVKIKLILFFLASTALNFLGIIAFGLGLLLTIPVTSLAQYVVYNTLLPKAKA